MCAGSYEIRSFFKENKWRTSRWPPVQDSTKLRHTVHTMRIIVASDIHGVDDALRAQLAVLGQPTILSPWPGEGCPFASEQEAVTEFLRQDGLATYTQKIANAANAEAAMLIGFSVGATSLWRYVADPQCNPQCHATLYYGSRIRDCTELSPRCPAAVFFAEHEASFDPYALAWTLRQAGSPCAVLGGTHHGFMRATSAHFRPDIAEAHFGLLARGLQPPTQTGT
jgi:hypothetical protein